MVQDAAVRNFEVIGEAANRVPEQYRTRYPENRWRLMAGFRNVLIHACKADLERIWEVASRDLPGPTAALPEILPPLAQLERELSEDKADLPAPAGE